MKKLMVLALVLCCGSAWAGGYHKPKDGKDGKDGVDGKSIVGPQGERGPAGPNHGLVVGLGGGLRHQEKWVDLDALVYKDIRHGGVTVLGLVFLKPFKSWQERENDRLKGQVSDLEQKIAGMAVSVPVAVSVAGEPPAQGVIRGGR